MLKKSEDFQLALLLYRNTPPAGHTYSPAQRMLCRRTRSTFPTSDNLLNPCPCMSLSQRSMRANHVAILAWRGHPTRVCPQHQGPWLTTRAWPRLKTRVCLHHQGPRPTLGRKTTLHHLPPPRRLYWHRRHKGGMLVHA